MKKLWIVLVLLAVPRIVGAQTCTPADLSHPLSVALTWVDNATGETGFQLERKLNTGAYAVVAAGIGANIKAYTDSTVVRGTTPNTYTYRIKAVAAAGGTDSPWSNEACITFAPTPPPALQAPSGLTTAAISTSGFRITWEDLDGEIGYELEGKEARGNAAYSQIASLPADTATYDWLGRKRYTPYCVRVRGLLPLGNSLIAATDYSLASCATTVK